MKIPTSTHSATTPRGELERLGRCIDDAMVADQPRLRRTLASLRRRWRGKGNSALAGELRRLAIRIERSWTRREGRRHAVPSITFPEALPVSAARGEIADLLSAHPVIVVSGATGSGKSTQLPKICLAAGRGVAGVIGVTEPRRIAARSVAARIASELAVPVGKQVGYQVRFGRQVADESLIKVMTDGILLGEIRSDPELRTYDTLIVDEVHERSLNVDFMLGYLRRLLERRADLKLVLASATIDTARFASFFGGAPVVDVEGRSYPVETRYDAAPEDCARDIPERVSAVVVELCAHGEGDILVFLAGEREIHDTAARLRRAGLAGVELLELYARMPFAAQQRVFGTHPGRRVVLATNIAETSITVPGIRYVIDSGRARVSRHAPRSGVQRLPVEPISRAAAEQRKGRCGRVAPGLCVRLYSQEDYAARPEHTEPEIRRTGLASVLLRMHAMGCGDPDAFPFIDPPQSRRVNDGLRLLIELGALDAAHTLTDTGRSLARLPIDPRIGRMLLAASELNCLHEILVLAAALSIPDPREWPPGKERFAMKARAEYKNERSDFVTLLNLWKDFRKHLGGRGGERLYAYCRRRFLSPTRMREWLDVHAQLVALARELKLGGAGERPASHAHLHRALLSGLLRNVGARAEQGEYTGLRDTRFVIARDSALVGSRAQFIVAGEIVDTGRARAHRVASIRPEWVEAVAGSLLRREYYDAYWDTRRGAAMVHERTAVYGLTLVARRRVRYAPVSQRGAHEIFVRALTEGQVGRPSAALRANRALIERLRSLDHKLRRPDAVLSEASIRAFYAARIPESIADTRGFQAWRRRAEQADPDCLRMRAADIQHSEPPPALERRYPDALSYEGVALNLDYRFAPGAEDDGITMTVPSGLLARLDPGRYEWLVAGLLGEKVTALLRLLPKRVRRELTPLAETVQAFLAQADASSVSLATALRGWLSSARGIDLVTEEADVLAAASGLPAHLRMRYRVVDAEGRTLAIGRDLARLQRQLAVRSEARPALSRGAHERFGLVDWPAEVWVRVIEIASAGGTAPLYPALVDEGRSVALCLIESEVAAREATRGGLRRLYLLRVARHGRRLLRALDGLARCELIDASLPDAPVHGRASPGDATPGLRESLLLQAANQAFELDRNKISGGDEFERAFETGRPRFAVALTAIFALCREILERYRSVRELRNDPSLRAPPASLADIDSQLSNLCFRGWLAAVPREALENYPRYLQALHLRLDKLLRGGAGDGRRTARIAPRWARYLCRAAEQAARRRSDPELSRYRWMIEELRVSLFAQQLGTADRISEQRVDAQWGKIGA